MQTITIPAKYKNKKLIPLKPLPEDSDYEAVILLIKSQDKPKKKLDQRGLLKIKPLSLGKIYSNLSREIIYEK